MAIEVADNGETILFVGRHIYFYNFPKRKLCGKFAFLPGGFTNCIKKLAGLIKRLNSFISLQNYQIRTIHFDFSK